MKNFVRSIAVSLLAAGLCVLAHAGDKPAHQQVSENKHWVQSVCKQMKQHEAAMGKMCAAPPADYKQFCHDATAFVGSYDKGFCGSQ